MSASNASPFSLLGLDSSLLDNLARLGYAEPTPVQRAAIPAVLAGGDLLVSSQTGSGKTAAFVLPGLQRLRAPAALPGMGPRMLVLTPTRELAMQVQAATRGYGSGQRLLSACLVGGNLSTLYPTRGECWRISSPVSIKHLNSIRRISMCSLCPLISRLSRLKWWTGSSTPAWKRKMTCITAFVRVK